MTDHRKRVSKSVDPLIGETLVLDKSVEITFTNSTNAGVFIDSLSTEALVKWVAFVNANRIIGELAPRGFTTKMVDSLAKRRHINNYVAEASMEIHNDIRIIKEREHAKKYTLA